MPRFEDADAVALLDADALPEDADAVALLDALDPPLAQAASITAMMATTHANSSFFID